jgi:uncharacterized OB-fold protein
MRAAGTKPPSKPNPTDPTDEPGAVPPLSTEVPFRILPRLGDHNRDFWTGGKDRELRLWRCQDCGYYIHPPLPMCPQCHSKRLATEAVSGRATLATYTINHQPFMPGPELPYVIAIIEIEEQPALRLMTNLVNCPHEQIRIGMPLRVTFEHHEDPDGDVYFPLFEPAEGARA